MSGQGRLAGRCRDRVRVTQRVAHATRQCCLIARCTVLCNCLYHNALALFMNIVHGHCLKKSTKMTPVIWGVTPLLCFLAILMFTIIKAYFDNECPIHAFDFCFIKSKYQFLPLVKRSSRKDFLDLNLEIEYFYNVKIKATIYI